MEKIYPITAKERIQSAFVALCKENCYEDITVPNICNLANLHRSTFYRYYESKDVLLREIEKQYIKKLDQIGKLGFAFDYQVYLSDNNIYKKTITELWEYSYKEREMIVFLLSPSLDGHFEYMFKSLLARGYNDILKTNGLTFADSFEQDYVIEYLISGLTSILYKFLRQDIELSSIIDIIYNLCINVPFSFLIKKKY